MIGPHRVEGYVIVSADGMIADGDGVMPDAIRNDADQRFFQAALDQAAVVLHGRHSHEGGPRATRRKRLVLTRHTPSIAPDPARPNSLLWNPVGAKIEQALKALGVESGPIAVIGGTEVFDLFLPLYDAFHLTRASEAKIPGGRPVFMAVGTHTSPEDVLAREGLRPGLRRGLDPAAGVELTTWERPRE